MNDRRATNQIDYKGEIFESASFRVSSIGTNTAISFYNSGVTVSLLTKWNKIFTRYSIRYRAANVYENEYFHFFNTIEEIESDK